ncbi:kelch repeat-containing protein [Elizabethkingia sp. JS20170427COW]|uniref:kelch repeat-containing protein n=1 Tax=Elizabethkingia sp. JS20170427COW TaxID=2583851 RepID=UPI001110EEB9|nr:kelch repeat-containing protein [Elizabethkingia sp. JS20170427COW]QCX54266.1 hypothetical protein FGE20_11205 [Elizabethkingia sp. JS20170427COW]
MKLLKIALLSVFTMNQAQNFNTLQWKVATELQGGSNSLGFAGMAAAKSNNGFIFCGGANFPKGLPWDGGKKTYTSQIFYWDSSLSSPDILTISLPKASGYFGYTSYQNQLFIAGGESSEGLSSEVFLISKDKIKELTELPFKVTAPAIIEKDNVIYLAGGDLEKETSNQFLSLQLQGKKSAWEKLADLPLSTANAAIFSIKDKIYLAGGRSKNPNGISTLHSEIFTYDIPSNTWKKETDIMINGKKSPFTAPGYFSYQDRYLIWAGGDDGKIFHQIETYLQRISSEQDEQKKQQLIEQKNYLVQHHLGFNNSVLIYDTASKNWLTPQQMPFTAQVTTASVQDDNKFYIFSGEVRPGVRSPKILVGELKDTQ